MVEHPIPRTGDGRSYTQAVDLVSPKSVLFAASLLISTLRRECRMPYLICMGSITIFVHPFPLTTYMPSVFAVGLTNILVFSGAYILRRVLFALRRLLAHWRRDGIGLGSSWNRRRRPEVWSWVRNRVRSGIWRREDVGTRGDGVEMNVRGSV